MKKYLQIIMVLLLVSAAACAQVLRPFTARYYNSSVRGNIVYVSNSIISTSGVGSGNPGTGEVPPNGFAATEPLDPPTVVTFVYVITLVNGVGSFIVTLAVCKQPKASLINTVYTPAFKFIAVLVF